MTVYDPSLANSFHVPGLTNFIGAAFDINTIQVIEVKPVSSTHS